MPKENPEAIDFNELRRKRDEALEEIVKACCDKYGWVRDEVFLHIHDTSCYCACPDGPCEHHFQGWRECEDGLGGEQVCSLCGMGAMSHGIRTCEF